MSDDHVTKHKVVSLTYRILDQGGSLLEQVDVPVSYVHGGKNELIEKLETALEDKKIGEQVELTVEPDEAFGDHDPALTYTDDIENVPPQFRKIGAEVEMQNDKGEVKTFVVSQIEDGKLTVDGNHPLAGKSLTFLVKVEAIRDATEDEIRFGVEQSPTTLH
jgi:FKBP-type peptidyl-prolyl cis-trans isomerase SlyD